MLELYRWEPTLDSGEPLIALKEKGLRFTDRYVDLRELEQHRPAFLRVNPSGQVPVIVDNGRVITEAGLALIYLEEAYPQHRLMPIALAGQYQAHFWIKYVEERMVPYATLLGWHRVMRPTLERAEIERARRSLEGLPRERRELWERALDRDEPADDLALAHESLTGAVDKLEQALARGPWLAGEAYSLADIALVLTMRALRAIAPEIVSAERTPRALEWLRRIEQRPAVREALALARTPTPDRVFVPGPEPPRWG